MAKKRNTNARNGNVLFAAEEIAETSGNRVDIQTAAPIETEREKSFLSGLGRGERIAIIGVCLLLVVGALGAGFGERIGSVFTSRKQSPKTNQTAQNSSTLASLNPFAAVVTLPTPQLSKEYIYAGSRMLAVEDANASAVPPTDLAVWRPGDGTWYVLNSQQQWITQQWGLSGDIPVPGDYDGDGKTDFSVFRPSNNTWYIVNSGGGTSGFPFGSTSSGDKPAQADYDGDGKTDAAVYRRPPTGTQQSGVWHIVPSTNTSNPISKQLGIDGDVPIPADYDGDGYADAAVWRDSNATFYVLQSSNNSVVTTQFGLTGDKPVPGDYDGDGKADFMVRRGNDWVSKNSKGTYRTQTWQTAGDKAVQNDYDADGKVDIAVWRPSNGTWYILNSLDSSTRTTQWGATGDEPVPAFYRR